MVIAAFISHLFNIPAENTSASISNSPAKTIPNISQLGWLLKRNPKMQGNFHNLSSTPSHLGAQGGRSIAGGGWSPKFRVVTPSIGRSWLLGVRCSIEWKRDTTKLHLQNKSRDCSALASKWCKSSRGSYRKDIISSKDVNMARMCCYRTFSCWLSGARTRGYC